MRRGVPAELVAALLLAPSGQAPPCCRSASP